MMKKLLFLISFILIPHRAFASDIHITEVLFNPAGADTGGEYVIVKNIGTTPHELTGWQLYPDGIGYFTFPSFTLDAGAVVKIFLRQSGSSSASALYHQTPSANMGNTAGSVALFSSSQHDPSTLIDFIQYGRSGETWEASADEAGLWIKGESVAVSAEEEGVILRRTSSDHSSAAWSTSLQSNDDTVESPESQSAYNVTSANSEEASTGGGKVSSGPIFTQKIRAFAGTDRTSIAGAEVAFTGRALDTEDQPLESQLVRYVWNFGDGTFAEGKNVSHAYLYPGTYTATLIVVQGEDMMQDECVVKVGDNTVVISEVMPSTLGWIELANTSALAVDISKWYLKDASGQQFAIPSGTRIAGGSFIVLGNDTTKLLQDTAGKFPITLHYQNGKEAHVFMYTGAVPAGLSVAQRGEIVAVGEKTPGRPNSKEKTESLAVLSKPVHIPKLPEKPIVVAAPTEERDESPERSQASVLNAPLPGDPSEVWLLLGSVAVGLFAGGAVTAIVHVRKYRM